jgi:hypothetical protein
MPQIQLGKDATLVFDSILTQSQVAKFGKLANNLMHVGTSAYLPLNELHGVLFTQSRAAATKLVLNHSQIIQHYLMPGEPPAIKPVGVYLLLEYLAEVNPKKAILYKAGLSLVALILATHPQTLVAALTASNALDAKIRAVFQSLKNQHQLCQLSGLAFQADESKHVHHIECASLNPALVAEVSNLVVIHEWIHQEYHQWVIQEKLPVCRSTLGLYAVRKRYSTPFVESLKAS